MRPQPRRATVVPVRARPRAAAGSPYPKASLLLRSGARAVDATVAWGLWEVCGAAGPLVALLYLLLADGMMEGQSPGKRLLGVRAVHLPSGAPARHRDSALRNAPLGLVVLLAMMPSPMGAVAGLAGLVVIGGVEAWRVVKDPLGLRLGDTWADTQVVDGKVVAGGVLPLHRAASGARAPGRLLSRRRAARRVS